ncbi:hypothetical protein EC988_009654, partial [Linderina pennispora]
MTGLAPNSSSSAGYSHPTASSIHSVSTVTASSSYDQHHDYYGWRQQHSNGSQQQQQARKAGKPIDSGYFPDPLVLPEYQTPVSAGLPSMAIPVSQPGHSSSVYQQQQYRGPNACGSHSSSGMMVAHPPGQQYQSSASQMYQHQHAQYGKTTLPPMSSHPSQISGASSASSLHSASLLPPYQPQQHPIAAMGSSSSSSNSNSSLPHSHQTS